MGVGLYDVAQSPLLQWRSMVYIVAGFAGVLGLALTLVQSLLAVLGLPMGAASNARRLHKISGAALVICVGLHVGLLWITSPPDVVDALTFMAPTWFSVWGVLAMWAVFGMALTVALRRRIPHKIWSRAHRVLGYSVGAGAIAHAMLIDGTMARGSKIILCIFVGVVMIALWRSSSVWGVIPSRRGPPIDRR